MEKLLTLNEAARVLQVHRSTLYRLSREGRLPIIKVAPRISRVRKIDLDRMIMQAGTVYQEGGQGDGTG